MTRIKICGITRAEDAHLGVELGAAALGFNFFPPSPRYIVPDAARELARSLPPMVTAVGIFAEENDAGRVLAMARRAGMQVVQLHGGREEVAMSVAEHFPLLRAISVGPQFDPASLASLCARAFLLDGYHPMLHGGTAKTFDWRLAREAGKYGTVVLAGGLNAQNVEQAIDTAMPFAVDVASGVESAPGIKDAEKMRAFFQAVQRADCRMAGGGKRD